MNFHQYVLILFCTFFLAACPAPQNQKTVDYEGEIRELLPLASFDNLSQEPLVYRYSNQFRGHADRVQVIMLIGEPSTDEKTYLVTELDPNNENNIIQWKRLSYTRELHEYFVSQPVAGVLAFLFDAYERDLSYKMTSLDKETKVAFIEVLGDEDYGIRFNSDAGHVLMGFESLHSLKLMPTIDFRPSKIRITGSYVELVTGNERIQLINAHAERLGQKALYDASVAEVLVELLVFGKAVTEEEGKSILSALKEASHNN